VGLTASDPIRQLLLSSRNPDGGWPYYRGKASRLEPTIAALLALGATGDVTGAAVVDRWPRRDGLFVDAAGEVNVGFNGLAALLLAKRRDAPIARDLVGALVRSRGVPIGPSPVNRQNNSIQAWSWTDGTFSWVESSAWCMLGLKRLTAGAPAPAVAARLHDGERLLADRVCRVGGWNAGNSNMLGTELPPYVPTTALALTALRDRAAEAYVVRSLAYLEAHRVEETGAMALALTRICLGVYDRSARDVETALIAEWHRSRYLENLHVSGLALYALTAGARDFEEFRV
jgi:hypothetical protein